MDNEDYQRGVNEPAGETPCFGQEQDQPLPSAPTCARDNDEDDDYQLGDNQDLDNEEAGDESKDDGRSGVGGTALAVISTIMGGGIVSIPYAYAVAGFWAGVGIQICVIVAIWISCRLYLHTRTMLRCQTNFSVIANLCLGSASSIILNMLLVFAVFGILALYMILFSEISISLMGDSYPDGHVLKSKAFYVTCLCVLISPIIVRKKIQELSFSTYVLFFGVLALIILLTVLLGLNGSYSYRVAEGVITPEAASAVVEEARSLEGMVDSLNIAVASQGFVIALFPIYSSMARSARPRVMTSVTGALLFTMSTYTYLSFISISYFGQSQVLPSIFNNIKQEEGLPALLLQCLFLVIFFCNIPFVFFAGKIAFMAVIHQCCYKKKPQTDEEFLNAEIVNAPDMANSSQMAPAGSAMSASFISRSIKGEVMPEDELPYMVYLSTCFAYLLIVALAAIFIDDLTLIFGIIAGLAECTTVFILPSIFYLVACHKEEGQWTEYNANVAQGMPARKPKTKKAGGTFTKGCVYVYLACGACYFGVSNYFTFAKIFK